MTAKYTDELSVMLLLSVKYIYALGVAQDVVSSQSRWEAASRLNFFDVS